MKAGRNDPCPCGSGKKFKKCCLEICEATAAAEAESQLALPGDDAELGAIMASERHNASELERNASALVPVRPVNPLVKLLDDLWEKFNDAPKGEREAIFLEYLDQAELPSDELAFEMLDVLFMETAKAGNRGQFDGLIERLRELHPDAYESNRACYLEWEITNALVEQRQDRVIALVCEMVDPVDDCLENLSRIYEMLAYYGQTSALAQANLIAWPQIQDSSDIFPWAKIFYANWGSYVAIFERLEKSTGPLVCDAALLDQFRSYLPKGDPDRMARAAIRLSGQSLQSWSLDDFRLTKAKKENPGKKKPKQNDAESDTSSEPMPVELVGWEMSLNLLLDEFVHFAHSQYGVSYTKAALTRMALMEYFTDRQQGRFEKIVRGRSEVRQRTPLALAPQDILVPDYSTLDRFLSDRVDYFNMKQHSAVATIELLPVWLRLLESHGLTTSARRVATLNALVPLCETLLKLMETKPEEPGLAEAIRSSLGVYQSRSL